MALTNLNDSVKLDTLKPEDIDSIGKSFGETLADKKRGIKTNQVRNVYSSILALRTEAKKSTVFTEKLKRNLVLIKPKLAYATGRVSRDSKMRDLYQLIVNGIDGVNRSENKLLALNNFILIVESIVAYHKYYGGKDK